VAHAPVPSCSRQAALRRPPAEVSGASKYRLGPVKKKLGTNAPLTGFRTASAGVRHRDGDLALSHRFAWPLRRPIRAGVLLHWLHFSDCTRSMENRGGRQQTSPDRVATGAYVRRRACFGRLPRPFDQRGLDLLLFAQFPFAIRRRGGVLAGGLEGVACAALPAHLMHDRQTAMSRSAATRRPRCRPEFCLGAARGVRSRGCAR
jgi:hypothetical protein